MHPPSPQITQSLTVRVGHCLSQPQRVLDSFSLDLSQMALGRALQLYYNTGQWRHADPTPSRACQPQAGLLPQCCFWGPHLPGLLSPFWSIMATELVCLHPDSVQLAHLESLGCRLLDALQEGRFLPTATHSLHSRPHTSLFTDALTRSLLCVLTASSVGFWEQVDRAASYSVTILDLRSIFFFISVYLALGMGPYILLGLKISLSLSLYLSIIFNE